ncbi:uncharacterized protein PHACADRAFT_211877 [Phanerochaete carnosa HHB-10118-sp]|uniref:F-box domain-containing protein n=1 Tax=Phanerochaete carnosa (strain HHB-10118-sp) TaxID=650164 RepID=K5VMF7_PHACS|nr:uncharacterized protein PHACADRAFT_211877 [Phanerochaete carnosa HHB-10118-sp]EKM52653.1 hypothetical protein PHACADRAFT_211877 [Phanerochaete carnosa HHB-10118-sp]
MQEAGAALPPEVVHMIVTWASRIYNPAKKFDRRGLAACSALCRHWAKIIRPTLFHTIIIRSHLDLVELLALMDATAIVRPPITDCIQDVIVEHRGAQCCPWLHRIYQVWKRLVRPTVEIILEKSWITAPSPEYMPSRELKPSAGLGLLPGQALPITLPGSLYPFFRVALHSLKLRRVADLVRFVHRLPMVLECDLRNVTFVEDLTLSPLRTLRIRGPLRAVTASDCGDGTLEAQIFLASTVLAARERLHMDDPTWSSLLQTVRYSVPQSCSSVAMDINESEDKLFIRSGKLPVGALEQKDPSWGIVIEVSRPKHAEKNHGMQVYLTHNRVWSAIKLTLPLVSLNGHIFIFRLSARFIMQTDISPSSYHGYYSQMALGVYRLLSRGALDPCLPSGHVSLVVFRKFAGISTHQNPYQDRLPSSQNSASYAISLQPRAEYPQTSVAQGFAQNERTP